MQKSYAPGGDAKAIARIAKQRFGGFLKMFEYHNWPERGQNMMRKVQTRVVETYGSVRAFEQHFQQGLNSETDRRRLAEEIDTMRFTSLSMKNFRNIRELKISFEPDITVIVGRNGVGKTSILDTLAITFGLVRAHSKDPDTTEPDLQPCAQDVLRGKKCARLKVKYTVGRTEQDSSAVNTLTVKVYDDNRLADFIPSFTWQSLSPRQILSPPRFIYYRQERGFTSGQKTESGNSVANVFDPDAVQDRSVRKDLRAIDDMGTWWDQRDAQEARRVRDGDHDYRDPQLEAIRNLIEKVDGFFGIAIDSTVSPSGLYFIKEDGKRIHVSGLSGGEQSYIILLADLARRLQVFAPGKSLDEIPAIVLIDEVELNLHPGWQSEIMPTLTNVFKACQFIVTTHSPQVLSGVKSEKVRIIEEIMPHRSSKVTVPLSTRGRTSNDLLEGILGASERFPPLEELIGAFNAAIDRQDIASAADTLNRLEQEIGDDVATLLVLRKRLKRLRSSE